MWGRWGIIRIVLVFLIMLLSSVVIGRAGEINPGGQSIADMIDQMDVEHHWLPGQGIEWKDGKNSGGRGMTSHCSAFVAAVCYKVNVYILRPPEHSPILLANAQFDWLKNHGREYGWIAVPNPAEAQQMANQGWLVVVSYRNSDRTRPGHIAVVRPSNKSNELVSMQGPQIAQAGMKNYNSISLRSGFKNHPGAWISDAQYQVNFYAHKTGVS